MPTSVASLFSSKICKFPPALIDLLEYCACLGNSFSPAEVSLLREMSLVEIFALLKPALAQGLLVERKNRLQFIHDKVKETVLSAIPAERRRQIHWQVGERLLAIIKETSVELEKCDNLFDIVLHLNLGREPQLDDKTAYLLSDLNYYAGNRALGSWLWKRPMNILISAGNCCARTWRTALRAHV